MRLVSRKFSERPFFAAPSQAGAGPFQARLDSLFNGEIRLRWSVREGLWHVEQRYHLQQRHKKQSWIDNWFDEQVRARDGYTLIMRVSDDGYASCENCGERFAIPYGKSVQTVCPSCPRKMGSKPTVGAAYFPLEGDALLAYLSKLDPTRWYVQTGRVMQNMDTAHATKLRLTDESASRERQAGLRDALIDQLPKAGFPSLVPDSWRH